MNSNFPTCIIIYSIILGVMFVFALFLALKYSPGHRQLASHKGQLKHNTEK